MQPETEIDWERTTVLLGIVLAILTILGKVWSWPFRFIWRQFGKVALWAGRRAIISFLRSHPTEAREYVAELFASEIAAGAALGKRVLELEDAVVNLTRDASADREAVREAMHEVAEKIELLADEHRKSNRTLHTLLGVVAGPEEVRAALRRELYPDSERKPYDGTERRERKPRGER